MTGDEVRRIREGYGEGQAEFARRIGVNQATICKWERRGFSDRISAAAAAQARLIALGRRMNNRARRLRVS